MLRRNNGSHLNETFQVELIIGLLWFFFQRIYVLCYIILIIFTKPKLEENKWKRKKQPKNCSFCSLFSLSQSWLACTVCLIKGNCQKSTFVSFQIYWIYYNGFRQWHYVTGISLEHSIIKFYKKTKKYKNNKIIFLEKFWR